MARAFDAEIDRLRAEISLVRVAETSGVALEKRGREYLGSCPFHADDGASLAIDISTNRWRCSSCHAQGDVIEWVMKRRGVSLRHAAELLKDGSLLTTASEQAPVKASTVRRLGAPVAADADDQATLNQVVGYYHETLKQSPEALAYLQARGLAHPEIVDVFRLGYANRTLGLRLPEKNRKAGGEMRSRLARIGLYRESGHEHFTGSLTIPILDERGDVQQVYGRKIGTNLRHGTPLHTFLPGPNRGVWNVEGVSGGRGEVILAGSLIDGLTFWCAGFRNVTAAYGPDGFTPDHMSAFRRYGVERVLIAYRRDEAGERGATELTSRLIKEGLACFRIEFPKSMDANTYAQKVTPAPKSLGVLVRKASWLGQGKPARLTSAPADELTAVLGGAGETTPASSEAAGEAREAAPLPEPTLISPMPSAPADDPLLAQSESELVMSFGDRRYRVRGWKKPLNPESMKMNVLVHRGERFHVDTFDLYSAKARASFVKQAGMELGEAEDTLKFDLGRVLLKAEALQDAELVSALKKEERPVIGEAERAAALELLKAPDLMDRILADFDRCGVVGEETNKLVGYLACVSRLLDKPLAVIIQSSSAAGKSSLMDAILALMPPQAQVRYSAMTGQSLFYMGETNLKHRILAIAEEEGAESASYALKLLQSDGEVTIASTGKDGTTGLLVAHEYRVEGPVMLFLTTTAIDIDEELMNRCLVLTVNESREQTRAIHALQRRGQTLEGLLAEEERKAIISLHRNAQGLLENLKVVNPFADRLTFLDDKTRTRRDHLKYLSLIRAVALLHQHQRPILTVQHRAGMVRYIEVEPADIALANRLAHEVLGRTLDELPPQTRRLLMTLHTWAREECDRFALRQEDFRFTRRQVRALTGWGDTQLKIHLARLAELEYVLIHRVRSGQGFAYELLYGGEGEAGERFLMGLSDIQPRSKSHTYDERRSGLNSARSEPGRGAAGGKSGGGRSRKSVENRSAPSGYADNASDEAQTRVQLPDPADTSHAYSGAGAGA